MYKGTFSDTADGCGNLEFVKDFLEKTESEIKKKKEMNNNE